jgi:hypothetical protein
MNGIAAGRNTEMPIYIIRDCGNIRVGTTDDGVVISDLCDPDVLTADEARELAAALTATASELETARALVSVQAV